MTDREIQQKLLDYYEECLKNLPLNYFKARWYIFEKSINLGLCSCSNMVFNEDIYSRYWTSGRFGKYPAHSASIKEMKELINIRIYKLKKLLSCTKDK